MFQLPTVPVLSDVNSQYNCSCVTIVFISHITVSITKNHIMLHLPTEPVLSDVQSQYNCSCVTIEFTSHIPAGIKNQSCCNYICAVLSDVPFQYNCSCVTIVFSSKIMAGIATNHITFHIPIGRYSLMSSGSIPAVVLLLFSVPS